MKCKNILTTYKKCPRCKYLISKIQIELARFDFNCPRYGLPALSQFIPTREECELDWVLKQLDNTDPM